MISIPSRRASISRCAVVLAIVVVTSLQVRADDAEIPNRLIDSRKFLVEVDESHALREKHRVTEEQFIEMAHDPATIVLDARSLERFNQMHIAGAKHLDFADFTESTLQSIVTSKDTRILIYCNNNIENAPVAFPSKGFSAALNLSTFVSLYSYGYRNVYELGPVVDPAKSMLKFEGTLVKAD